MEHSDMGPVERLLSMVGGLGVYWGALGLFWRVGMGGEGSLCTCRQTV